MIVYLDFKNGLNSKLSANFTNFRKFFAGGGGGGGVLKQKFQQKVRFLHYIWKCCFCISFEADFLPSYDDTLKLIELVGKHVTVEGKN